MGLLMATDKSCFVVFVFFFFFFFNVLCIAVDLWLTTLWISEALARVLGIVKMIFGNSMQKCTAIILLPINNNLVKKPGIQCLALSWG